jgi:hypothetical protein
MTAHPGIDSLPLLGLEIPQSLSLWRVMQQEAPSISQSRRFSK